MFIRILTPVLTLEQSILLDFNKFYRSGHPSDLKNIIPFTHNKNSQPQFYAGLINHLMFCNPLPLQKFPYPLEPIERLWIYFCEKTCPDFLSSLFSSCSPYNRHFPMQSVIALNSVPLFNSWVKRIYSLMEKEHLSIDSFLFVLSNTNWNGHSTFLSAIFNKNIPLLAQFFQKILDITALKTFNASHALALSKLLLVAEKGKAAIEEIALINNVELLDLYLQILTKVAPTHQLADTFQAYAEPGKALFADKKMQACLKKLSSSEAKAEDTAATWITIETLLKLQVGPKQSKTSSLFFHSLWPSPLSCPAVNAKVEFKSA